jgi:hypothetical protein
MQMVLITKMKLNIPSSNMPPSLDLPILLDKNRLILKVAYNALENKKTIKPILTNGYLKITTEESTLLESRILFRGVL